MVLVPRCVPLYLVDVHGSCFPQGLRFWLSYLVIYLCYLSYLSYLVILLENRVIWSWLRIAITYLYNNIPWKTCDSYTNHLVFRWCWDVSHWASQTLVQPEQRNNSVSAWCGLTPGPHPVVSLSWTAFCHFQSRKGQGHKKDQRVRSHEACNTNFEVAPLHHLPHRDGWSLGQGIPQNPPEFTIWMPPAIFCS